MVVAQPSMDIPVFLLKPETSTGRIRTLHQKLLLPIPNLPLDVEVPPKPRPRQRKVIGKQEERDSPTDLDSDRSTFGENSSEYGHFVGPVPKVHDEQLDSVGSVEVSDEVIWHWRIMYGLRRSPLLAMVRLSGVLSLKRICPVQVVLHIWMWDSSNLVM